MGYEYFSNIKRGVHKILIYTEPTLTNHLSTWGFLEVKIDNDGLYSGLVLPPAHSLFLWRSSWISLLSGIYAIWRRHYILAPVPLGVWITSINYWRHPVQNSIRRKMDISYVLFAFAYQIQMSIRHLLLGHHGSNYRLFPFGTFIE